MTRAAFHLALELPAAISIETFRAAFPERNASTFVLEGGGAFARLDRFSFMGASPIASFRARRRTESGSAVRDALGRVLADVVIEDAAGRRDARDAVDPFSALGEFLSRHAVESSSFDGRHPFPFRAGLVGYIGYECGQTLERLPCLPRPSVGMPDMAFALHRWVISTSRESGKSWLSILGMGDDDKAARADAETTRDHVLTRLDRARGAAVTSRARASALSISASRPSAAGHDLQGLSRAEYVARVATAKAHIAAGDAFEICLTNALRAPLARTQAWALFDELRRSNPAPFAALLDLPEGAVVSSSPERFLSLDARGVAESRPIKGTRPRGTTPEDDERLARDLASSEKDRAENAMIVDLVRNDLGKVCRFGTVEAPELFAVERYATVHQLVSTVCGELDANRDAIDLLRACFPPGSMTGAPKIEAMTILEHIEPVERGVYSGALGWIDLSGAMDLSVVIRTAVVKDDLATFSVGGAVVADSDPHAEHEETEHKARAIISALDAVSHEPARERATPKAPAPADEQHP